MQTLRRKDAELSVTSLHLFAFSNERLSAAQTVPETDTTAMFMSNANSNADALSQRKYLRPS